MRFASLFFCLFAAFASLPATAIELYPPEAAYSGTRTLRANDMEASGPFAYDSGKERFEVTVQGIRQILIRRPDLDRSFAIMPDIGTGQDMALRDSIGVPPLTAAEKSRVENLGRESLEGEDVTKYRLVEGAWTAYFWLTDDGIPLLILGESEDRNLEIRLTNLARGPQPAELFEVPSGIRMSAAPR